MTFKEALMRLRSYPEFAIVMKEVAEQRPFLTPFNPKGETDQSRWIYDSGRLNGFDILYQFLGGKQ